MKLTSIYRIIFLFAIYSGLITEGVAESTYDEDGFCIGSCVCNWFGCPDLSKCERDCSCENGGCDMSQCTKNCVCGGGNCDMSSCKGFTCSCNGGGCKGTNAAYIVGKIVVPIVVILLGLLVLFCCWRKRRNRKMAEAGAYAPTTQTQDHMFPVKQEGTEPSSPFSTPDRGSA